MAQPSTRRIVEALLEVHGRTYASQAGIRLARNTPAPLFQLLCLSLLLSARISADVAVRSCRALLAAGWTTPDVLARSSWSDRTRVLNEAGYARYDERTSRMLGQTAGIFRNPDGSLVLRFENLDIENGPDLEVYLVPGADQVSLPARTRRSCGARRSASSSSAPPSSSDLVRRLCLRHGCRVVVIGRG